MSWFQENVERNDGKRRYKVLTAEGKVKTVYSTDREMDKYVKMGTAVESLPEWKYPWCNLYDSKDPLYGNYIADPDNMEDTMKAYPTLRKSLHLLSIGAIGGSILYREPKGDYGWGVFNNIAAALYG